MAELNRPLLLCAGFESSIENIKSMELPSWPKEAAAHLKLVVPREYSNNAGYRYCRLQLNVEQRLLNVVAVTDEDDHILDVIDIDDMIGAQLTIGLMERTAAIPATTNSTEPVVGRADNEPAGDTLEDRQGQATLTIYSYPRRNPVNDSWMKKWCGLGSSSTKPNSPSYQRSTDSSTLKERIPHHRSFLLAPAEDLTQANLVLEGIRRLATGFPSERKFLVVCSPVSGPRKDGPLLYKKKVQPILEQAGITTEIFITAYAGHGRKRMAVVNHDTQEKDISSYDGIVIMGGDGLISEIVNGIMDRNDADLVLRKAKIGVIGCGTANGLVASLAKHASETDDLMTSIFMIAKSRTIQIDLSKYQTKNSSHHSFLSYEYAMIADIDIKSEVVRWLGSFRFDLWGALSVLRMKHFRARFTYLPAAHYPAHKTNAIGVMPATVEESIPDDSKDWVSIEDDFLIFWPSQTSHAASRTHHSPGSLIQDGIFKVLIVRGRVSRLTMAMILIGLETGSHVNYSKCEFIDCCAYRLDPITPGLSVLDGEVIEEGSVQAKVLPAALKVFCHVPCD